MSAELKVPPSEATFVLYVWSCGKTAIGGLPETGSTKMKPPLSEIESASSVRYNSQSRIGRLLSLARRNLRGSRYTVRLPIARKVCRYQWTSMITFPQQ